MKRTILMIAAIAAAFAHGQSARFGSLGRNDVVVTNLAPATSHTDRAIEAFAATGSVSRVHDGTNIIDAAGCVWEVAGSWWLSPSNYTGSSVWYADRPIYLVATHVPGEWWRPSCEGDFIGIGKGEESSTSLEWRDEDAYIDILALRVIHTNLVGRVALTNDITEAIREQSLCGIWDSELQTWWTPQMLILA